jgi:uncharacterized protein
MIKRRPLGDTGLSVSPLGFGAMRLPMRETGDARGEVVDRDQAIPMFHRAFESGVNYVDTAVMYCRHDSQSAVGEALEGWRDRVILSTKNHFYAQSDDEWRKNLDDSLQRLRTDHIDVYHHHALNWEKWTEHVEPRLSRLMRRARDEGLIRHIAFSFHDKPEVLPKLIDAGYAEVITVQYNLLDRSLEKAIAYAGERGVGVVVMGPVGGGRLGVSSEVLEHVAPNVRRVPELALRFVLSHPHVSTALSGMSTLEQVGENVRTASLGGPLSEEERAIVDAQLERLKAMADSYCTGCRYCLPCPNEVNIPGVFDLYNRGKVYGLWESARDAYAAMQGAAPPRGRAADACIACGECVEKCPQKIPILEQLAEAHQALSGS